MVEGTAGIVTRLRSPHVGMSDVLCQEAADEIERLLGALWQIRMDAERATIDEPPWALPSKIIHTALSAIGPNRKQAQVAADFQRAGSGANPDAEQRDLGALAVSPSTTQVDT